MTDAINAWQDAQKLEFKGCVFEEVRALEWLPEIAKAMGV